MVFIGNQKLEKASALSATFNTILTFIPGGLDWLNWAIQDTAAPATRADNENQLLEIILGGLHMDTSLRLNVFEAKLDKIETLEPSDLTTLAQLPVGAKSSTYQPILQKYDIRSYEDLQAVPAYLEKQEINTNRLFQSLSLSDLLALYPVVIEQANLSTKLRADAVAFALPQAVNPTEFARLFFFFVESANNQVSKNLASALRMAEIQGVYKKFVPLSYYLIYTPNAGKNATEPQLRQGLRDLAHRSNFIGYQTVSCAALNLTRNVVIKNQEDAALKQDIEQYLVAIKNHIYETPTPQGVLAQDGSKTTFRIEDDKALAVVDVDEYGYVYLAPETHLKTN